MGSFFCRRSVCTTSATDRASKLYQQSVGDSGGVVLSTRFLGLSARGDEALGVGGAGLCSGFVEQIHRRSAARRVIGL